MCFTPSGQRELDKICEVILLKKAIMREEGVKRLYSATDLLNYLGCSHASFKRFAAVKIARSAASRR